MKTIRDLRSPAWGRGKGGGGGGGGGAGYYT